MADLNLEAIAGALTRLSDRYGRLVLELDFSTGLNLIASVQLALRHPHFPDGAARDMRALVDGLLRKLERDEPELVAILRAGDDPTCDVPALVDVDSYRNRKGG